MNAEPCEEPATSHTWPEVKRGFDMFEKMLERSGIGLSESMPSYLLNVWLVWPMILGRRSTGIAKRRQMQDAVLACCGEQRYRFVYVPIVKHLPLPSALSTRSTR